MRKRPEDIQALADHFLRKFNEETGRRLTGFSPAAIEALRRYRWPGNVMELKNAIERAVVLARGEVVDPEDLTLSKLATAGDSADVAVQGDEYEPLSLADVERRHILATLNATVQLMTPQWVRGRAMSLTSATWTCRPRAASISRPSMHAPEILST